MEKRKVYVSSLAAAMLMSMLLPAAALAAPGTVPGSDGKEYISEGKITYKQGNQVPGKVTDPVEGEDIDEPDEPTEHSPLMIVGATSYVFGAAENDSTTRLTNYSAQPFEKVQGGNGTGEYTPHFIEFRDLRSNNFPTGRHYKLSGQITKPFTNGTSVLSGAKVKYTNVAVQSQKISDGAGGYTTPYKTGVSGTDYTLQSNFTLSQTGNAAGTSVDIYEHTNAEGYGRFHLVFGTNTTNQADPAVQLEVPANQVIANGTYTGEITWTMSTTYTP